MEQGDGQSSNRIFILFGIFLLSVLFWLSQVAKDFTRSTVSATYLEMCMSDDDCDTHQYCDKKSNQCVEDE